MQNNEQKHLYDILKQIVTDFGKQIFDKSESRRLDGVLSDYMTEDRAMQRLFRLAVTDGIAHELLQCDASDRASKAIRINSLKVKFKEENSLEESRACFVVDCFAYALGFITDIQPVVPLIDNENVKETKSVKKQQTNDNPVPVKKKETTAKVIPGDEIKETKPVKKRQTVKKQQTNNPVPVKKKETTAQVSQDKEIDKKRKERKKWKKACGWTGAFYIIIGGLIAIFDPSSITWDGLMAYLVVTSGFLYAAFRIRV
jgi:hypothetical protein